VKGWYMYHMGPAAYDLSAWGNDGHGAWRRGHSATVGFLPPGLLASQSSATFPRGSYLSLGPSKAKEGIWREPLDDMGGGLALMPPPFCWCPLSQTRILGRPGQLGTPEEHIVAGLVA
jgi:hypothetical protein